VFNVKTYGATGKKADNAQKAIQSAVDACGKAGGGMVYLPPGDYTSGTIYLRSHVRFHVEAGATLWASTEESAFPKTGLLYGEDLQNITIEGRGTIDGQAEYFWRTDDTSAVYPPPGVHPVIQPLNVALEIERRSKQPGSSFEWHNEPFYGHIGYNRRLAEERAQAHGQKLMRAYPKGYGERHSYPHLILLLRCKDVRITGLSFLRSPSWTINPYACERLTIDGIYIYTSLKDAVWADGIDPDGCKDVRIANSTIETGDDAIVFYSSTEWGPALPCENITVTNCRLSSASAGLKFCDGNRNCVRNVTVDNCVITDSNRGIAFMVAEGGYVQNVVLSNLVINTHRFDWFWWGDGEPIFFMIERHSEMRGQPDEPGELPAGSIRDVIIRNVIAHGQGSSVITGHPQSWLSNISLENVKLFLSTDPAAPYDKAVNAIQVRYARDLKMKDVEVTWEKPKWQNWQSALYLEDVAGVRLEGFVGGPAKPQTDIPVVVFDKVDGATVRSSRARPGSRVFVKVKGASSRGVTLTGNELYDVDKPYDLDIGVRKGSVRELDGIQEVAH
jgi:polygalacturonase